MNWYPMCLPALFRDAGIEKWFLCLRTMGLTYLSPSGDLPTSRVRPSRLDASWPVNGIA